MSDDDSNSAWLTPGEFVIPVVLAGRAIDRVIEDGLRRWQELNEDR